ncbi:MAG: TRAP transporter substrate-binding protein [Spirochaetes bacterium]|nr:TRAP transporter substrate-binding protein [Spirochaetota bacterium]
MKRFCRIRLLVLLAFTISTLFIAVGCGKDSNKESALEIRFATFFPPTHKLAIITEEWCKEITKRTDGKIKVTQYAGGTLTPAPQTYDAVVEGVADAGNTVLGYTMGKFPLSEVLDYPLGYTSGTLATNLLNSYYKEFNPKEFDDVKVMYFHAQSPGILHSKVPIKKLEDLKGIKIRCFGSNAEFVKLLGGVPVATPMAEAYDALSKGVANGAMLAYEALGGWKLGEVLKYNIENYYSAYTASFIVMMNKDKWAGIPESQQKIIEDINREWIKKQGKVWDELDEVGKNFAREKGNIAIKLSEKEQARWLEKAQPLYDKYVASMKEKGLPGEKVLKFCQDYLKKN